MNEASPLLEARALSKTFDAGRRGLFRPALPPVHAVQNVSLAVHAGRTLGVVGESGCGKSTLARLITRILPSSSGTVHFAGDDVTTAEGAELARFRANVQMVFQDPMGSLNPRQTVEQILRTPRRFLPAASEGPTNETLLQQVGLPVSALSQYPHEFSGGQRQRIGIARALVAQPKLIVADEPVSALDVSIQAQILNLLLDLQAEMGLTFVLISHDLSVVRRMADTVAVMYLGRVVEHGRAEDVLMTPAHPYTKALAGAVLQADKPMRRRIAAPRGEVTSKAPDIGCAYRARCPLAEERCAVETPVLRLLAGTETQVACHLA